MKLTGTVLGITSEGVKLLPTRTHVRENGTKIFIFSDSDIVDVESEGNDGETVEDLAEKVTRLETSLFIDPAAIEKRLHENILKFEVEAQHELTSYDDLGNVRPFKLADGRIVPIAKIDQYVDAEGVRNWRSIAPVRGAVESIRDNASMWMGSASWQGVTVPFTGGPYIIRQIGLRYRTSRSSPGTTINGKFLTGFTKDWQATTLDWREVTRSPQSELNFSDGSGSDVVLNGIDVYAETDSTITIGGVTVQQGETVEVPEALATDELPADLYLLTHTGRTWALSPVRGAPLEYADGIRLSQAPSGNTIMVAYSELVASLHTLQSQVESLIREQTIYSADAPDLAQDWGTWVQQTAEAIAVYKRTEDGNYFKLGGLN